MCDCKELADKLQLDNLTLCCPDCYKEMPAQFEVAASPQTEQAEASSLSDLLNVLYSKPVSYICRACPAKCILVMDLEAAMGDTIPFNCAIRGTAKWEIANI